MGPAHGESRGNEDPHMKLESSSTASVMKRWTRKKKKNQQKEMIRQILWLGLVIQWVIQCLLRFHNQRPVLKLIRDSNICYLGHVVCLTEANANLL